MKKVLIVVDMQNDFIYGPLGTKEAQAIVPKVKEKIEEYNTRGDLVIFTRDTHTNNYLETNEGKYLPIEHCIKYTEGWKIIDEISHFGDHIFNKDTFGYHRWFTLAGIKGLSEIEMVGVCTDICVISNALILKMEFPEANIIVDATCCAGTTPEKHAAALEVMKSCQIEVIE